MVFLPAGSPALEKTDRQQSIPVWVWYGGAIEQGIGAGMILGALRVVA